MGSFTDSCLSCLDRCCHISSLFGSFGPRSEGIYDSALADSEREAVSELLAYLDNVRLTYTLLNHISVRLLNPCLPFIASRYRFLFWRTPSSVEHFGIFR